VGANIEEPESSTNQCISKEKPSYPKTAESKPKWIKHLGLWLMIIGPGLMVMLADTDAGSIITAAQSGAQWGYTMILPQLILIPFLYVVQEMTVRLGLVTRKGHGELIRAHFGAGWAFLSVFTLFISALGALVTEFVGIGGVGEMFHIPLWLSVPVVTGLLVAIGLTGSYRRVERIGIAVGLLELFFLPAALLAHPDWHQMASSLTSLPITQGNFLFLLAANIGAVIMPWMIFYQQGAVIDKHLWKGLLGVARWDTWLGAVLTQVIMMLVVIATAATIGKAHPGASLNSIQDIAAALRPALGPIGATLFAGLGMIGAGFLAAIVVSLAGAWGIGEALGINHSLNLPFKKAKGFYTLYTIAHVGGAIIVLSGIPLINLTLDIEVMNALLLPIVLGFLLLLERVALPTEYRMRGVYRIVAWGMAALVMLFGLYMAGDVVVQTFFH
jgi:Mn2+/Fe2+ NRAMP family transporter